MATLRLLGLSGANSAGSASKLRLLGLSGSDTPTDLAATIVGPSEVDAFCDIVLDVLVTGGAPTGYTWSNTGPTLTPAEDGAHYVAAAPGDFEQIEMTFTVTVDPGGATDTHAVTVWPAGRYVLRNGELEPQPVYVLVPD